MTTYSYEKDEKLDVIKVWKLGEFTKVAEFMLEGEDGGGEEAFQTFCAGIVAKGHSLYSVRTKRYIIGNIHELLTDI